MKKFMYLPFIAALSFFSCKKEVDSISEMDASDQAKSQANASFVNTFYGPQVQMGNGKVRSFVRINHNDVPQELGLIMSGSSFENLPAMMSDAVLPLHPKAKEVTPYDHIFFGWMPDGHPPAVFSQPHFDVHFYMIPEAERMMIPAPTPSNMNLFAAPPAGYLPADYTTPFAIIPMMGRHWLDATSNILSPGAVFTHEFIYGTFNQKVAFLEPMIAKSFLMAIESGTAVAVHQAIKQPSLFDPSGKYYPTRYNIYTDGKGNVYISVDQFVLR